MGGRSGAMTVFLCLATICDVAVASASQVHLSLGDDVSDIVVTWSTDFAETEPATVRYWKREGPIHYERSNVGISNKFVDNGTLHHTQYIHRVVIAGLQLNSSYNYQVWNASGYGPTTYSFTTLQGHASSWTNPRFTVFGDFGLENHESFPALLNERMARTSDVIIHTGDFAYDLYKDNATWGDKWFQFMEPVAAYQPYMACIGNHEGMYDALNYRQRFTMPQYFNKDDLKKNLWFSWNAGNVHFIAYDTEVYFTYVALTGHGGVGRNFGPYPELAAAQRKFVEQDLMEATKPANRKLRPWIVVYGHRPMYCSDSDDTDCTKMNNKWKADLEPLFFKYGVDLVLEAHQHTYERLWPVYNGTVYNGSLERPYTNPGAPVHIVSGSAGCDENLDRFNGSLGPWSAVRDMSYGYGHLNVMNATHLQWEQLYAGNQTVLDSIWIVKTNGHEHSYGTAPTPEL